MREIKFRAWHKKNRTMIQIFDCEHQTEWFLPNLNENYEVMQYTGAKDREGKDIYEGDIVIDKWENVDVIRFHEFYGTYYTCPVESVNVKNGEIEKLYSFTDLMFRNNVPAEYLEVIGNVHENPEYLTY